LLQFYQSCAYNYTSLNFIIISVPSKIEIWKDEKNEILHAVSQDDDTSLALLKKATAQRREAMKPKRNKPKTREIPATKKSNNPKTNIIIFVVPKRLDQIHGFSTDGVHNQTTKPEQDTSKHFLVIVM